MVTVVTTDTFENEVLKSDKPVLLDCFATWCGPCKAMAPILDVMSEKFAGQLKVCKLDVDEDGGVIRRYRVMSIPNFLFFKDGQMVKQAIGAMDPESFEKLIQEVIA